MMDALLDKLSAFRATRLTRRSRYQRALADIPPALLPYWQTTAHLEFEGIPRGAFFYARAAEGLMMFFDCVSRSSVSCGLPSNAADSVWHAWQRMDPDGLGHFCVKHFGRVIVHTEASQMPLAMNVALGACLVAARSREAMVVTSPVLPSLFQLDRRLRMPAGCGYVNIGPRIYLSRLDAKGRVTHRMVQQEALTAVGLLAAGLISDIEYEDYLVRCDTVSRESGCGASAYIGSDAGDCSSGDGGGSGGSCGGGGCGGGCGS